MAPLFGLKLVDASGTELKANILTADDGSQQIAIKTASVEPGAVGEEFRVPIGPVDGGLAADRILNPRGYSGTSGSGADTSWPSMWTLPPKTNSLTLTSAVAMGSNAEVRMAVEYGSSLFILSGRYVHSVNSSHTVATARDLGSGNVGSFLSVVGGSLIVCCGNTDPIHKRNSAGTWSTSSDVYAQVILPTKATIWRVRNGSGAGVDNSVSGIDANTSSLETALMTNANWTAPGSAAGYVVGDSSYQVVWGVEYQGQPWFGRDDGIFQADVNGDFHNRTPQMKESPVVGNTIGASVIFGSLMVPSKNRGLIRVRSGEALAVGPETTGAPNKSWWVRSMVEHNRACWMLATNEQGTRQSILKMVPNEIGVTAQDYIFHEIQDVSGTNKSPWIQVFQSPTNPEVFWGGGSATTSCTYFRLGNGGGRDIDDANYQYAATGEIVTGNIYPSRGRSMRATLHGVDVYFNAQGTSPTLAVKYNVDDFIGTEPSTTMYTNREAVSGSSVSSSGRYRFYAATASATGNTFNFLFTLSQGGTPASTTRSSVHEAYAFGVLAPVVTDYIQVGLDVGDGDGVNQNGQRIGKRTSEVFRQLKAWENANSVLTLTMLGYEENKTVRVAIVDAQEGVKEITNGTNRPKRTTVVTLVMKRMDYAGAYAT